MNRRKHGAAALLFACLSLPHAGNAEPGAAPASSSSVSAPAPRLEDELFAASPAATQAPRVIDEVLAASPRDPLGPSTGDRKKLAAATAYFSMIQARIIDRLTVPAALSDGELSQLEVVLRITLNAGGALESASLAKPSGNRLFDDACLAAVRAASPFNRPPPDLDPAFLNNIEIRLQGE